MNLFSRNIGLTVKTIVYQIVMSIFGFMMYSATRSNVFLLVAGQAMVILFFLYIMFSQMLQSGGKMKEYDHAHDTTSSPAAGFLFAFISFLPTILLAAWTMIFPPFSTNGTPNSTGYIPFLLNKSFLQGMYLGVVQAIFPTTSAGVTDALISENSHALNSQSILYLFGALPGIITCGLGYWIGYLRFDKKRGK